MTVWSFLHESQIQSNSHILTKVGNVNRKSVKAVYPAMMCRLARILRVWAVEC